MFQVYTALGSLEGIPTGFEGTKDFDFRERKIIQIQNGTLREILDSITIQEPNYKWELVDGVVNLYPVNLRDETLKDLLDLKIKRFSSNKEKGRVQIADCIENLVELKTLLNSKHLKLGIFAKTNLYLVDETTNINLSDTDLKSILNKIVKDSGDSKLWTISRNEIGEILLTF